MHQSNPWAFDWLKRYDKEEGLEGLKDRITAVVDRLIYQKKQVAKLSKNYPTLNKVDGQQNRLKNQSKEKWYQISLYSYIPYSS